MGLFGITLKKLEAIPGELVHGAENLYHDVTGGSSGSGPSYTPPSSNGGGGFGGGNNNYQPGSFNPRQPVPVRIFQQPQQMQQGPPPMNPAMMKPPQQFTPQGMHRDKNGNLVPDTFAPQVTQPTGPDPVGKWLDNTFAKPVVNLAHGVGASTAGQAVRLATAELTHNDQSITDAKAGFGQAVRDLAPPQPYLDDQGNPTHNAPPKGSSKTYISQHTNPAYNEYLITMASGGEGEGLGAASVSSREARAAASAKSAGKPVVKTPKVFSAPEGSTAPKTSVAFQKLNDLYDHDGISADNSHQLIGKSIGISRNFSKAGDDLQTAMQSELTPSERVAVRDTLEGQEPQFGPKDNPAKVQEVATMAKQLSDKGYDVLDKSSKTGIHRVQQYATRLANFKGTKPAVSLAQKGFSDLKSLFNIHSGFANSRAIGKYVGEDGTAKYGTKTDLGLTKNKNGDLVDSNGMVHTPQEVSTRELKQNGFNYEDDYGKISNAYHTSVGRVKVAQAAKDELLNNPEKYGLVKLGDGAAMPKGYDAIRQVPELADYAAPTKDAADIDNALGHPRQMGLIERGWQGLNNGIIQSIVYNPLFHARNLNELAGLAAGKAKNTPFGGAVIKKAYLDLAQMTKEEHDALTERMNAGGVVKETYGTDRGTVLSNALDKAHLPHVNKASSAAMAHIDWNIRSALFHLATTGKNALKDEDAAALVNHFLGDKANMGPIARNAGLFWHYFKTRTGIVTDAVKHPIANRGTIMTGAVQAAFLFAATKAFQEWTGNKHASLGHPGVFGLETDASNIIHGRPGAVAASKISPTIMAALNQLYGTDLYTGNKLSTGSERLTNLKETLLAPTQTTDKVNNGKESAGQAILQSATGISLPHVKGAPAVPNANNPIAATMNTKGATPTADEGNIHDPTGLDQAKLYYNAKNKALQATAGDPNATDAINLFMDDPSNAQGQKMKKSPQETLAAANAIAGNPTAMKAMQQFQKSQPNHDPMWDLSSSDLKTFLDYEGSRQETGERAAAQIIDTKFNNGEGLSDFIKQRDAYYGQLKLPPGSAVDNPDTPKYPSFQGQQLVDYNTYESQYKNAPSPAKAAFLQAHPEVTDALTQISDYYDKQNVAQGGLSVKKNIQLSPDLQKAYDEYNALPKGNGKYGGSPDRSAWIKAHPQEWAGITTALANSDLVTLAKQGAIDQYEGVPYSQSFLKSAYAAGKYDIAPNQTLPDGSTGYAVNPPAAAADNGSGGSSSRFVQYSRRSSAKQEASYQKLSTAFSKYRDEVHAASQQRDVEHIAKANKNLVKNVQRVAKLRGPKRMSIHMAGETGVSPHRVKGATLKARTVNKVALKPQRTLNRSNHAKLKT